MGMHSTPATPGVNMPNNFPGQLGLFGSGQFQVFYVSGAFKVPAGVSRIRVRVVGGGGAGYRSIGGQAAPVNGGTTSFAGLISASGGNGGSQTPGATIAGGTGTGGDFQASGGYAKSGGGGAAGSQLGRGGNSFSRAGAGVGGGDTAPDTQSFAELFGGSPFGVPSAGYRAGAPNALGENKASNPNRPLNPPGFYYRFPFECFFGAGGETIAGTSNAECGGVGGGASAAQNGPSQGQAAAGGIGGGGAQPGSSSPLQGVGGIGGGGPGVESFQVGGGGGGGYAHGVFDVTEGATLMATVAAAVGNGGPGLCVVEW